MADRSADRVVDRTGQRVGQLRVLRRAPNSATGYARWICQCDCGSRCVVQGNALHRAAQRGSPYACPVCRPRAGRPGRVSRDPDHVLHKRGRGRPPRTEPRCGVCRKRGHGTAACPLRGGRRYCVLCCDLPHRRPRVGLCRGCGLAFREEGT